MRIFILPAESSGYSRPQNETYIKDRELFQQIEGVYMEIGYDVTNIVGNEFMSKEEKQFFGTYGYAIER